ncbi:MAG: nickel pincer cofactor biosynthesis protein LarC [Candidatus Hydrogenedens sp.]|nr:nickel pincer cofactor biosynthesis protein LarC [Candidatus Hydrogenedens sp.]
MKIAYFDCFSGISGDMTVGALLDAGADFGALKAGLDSLGVEGYEISAEKIVKKGVTATKFRVRVEGQEDDHHHDHDHAHKHDHEHHHEHDHGHEHHQQEHEHSHAHSHAHEHTHSHGHTHEHSHEHEHGHHHHHHHEPHKHEHKHHHPHRHLRHVEAIIDAGDLPQPVKDGAKASFRILAEAEASVHGMSIESVHFHEVGAVDSIVDTVGAHLALHLLGVEAVYASNVHVGSGTIKCAHGIMPVPAPATARLLRDIPTYGGEVQGELVTPTGAALLKTWAKGYGRSPAMRASAIGYGAGDKDLPDRANVLRVQIGEAEDAGVPLETVGVVEANVDDMSGELVPVVIDALLAAGAKDAFVTPAIGKKGRPAYVLTALCEPAASSRMAELMLRNSTSIGARIRTEQRLVADRRMAEVETSYGPIAVKVASLGGALLNAAPEFESCRAAAEHHGATVKTVYLAALAAAQSLEG